MPNIMYCGGEPELYRFNTMRYIVAVTHRIPKRESSSLAVGLVYESQVQCATDSTACHALLYVVIGCTVDDKVCAQKVMIDQDKTQTWIFKPCSLGLFTNCRCNILGFHTKRQTDEYHERHVYVGLA